MTWKERADMLDAALAERDALRERAVTAEQERDRLRREVESLRDSLRTNLAWGHSEDADALWHELSAILAGGKS